MRARARDATYCSMQHIHALEGVSIWIDADNIDKLIGLENEQKHRMRFLDIKTSRRTLLHNSNMKIIGALQYD